MLDFQGSERFVAAVPGIDIQDEEPRDVAGDDSDVCRRPAAPPGPYLFRRLACLCQAAAHARMLAGTAARGVATAASAGGYAMDGENAPASGRIVQGRDGHVWRLARPPNAAMAPHVGQDPLD